MTQTIIDRKLNPARWTFLTAPEDIVQQTAVALNFKFQMIEGLFAHSNLIAVLDENGILVHREEALGADPAPTIAATSDVYVGDPIAFTIYDSNGIDTIDFSNFSQNQEISLIALTYSDIGGLTDNMTIARGVVIENATGGSGNDTLTGNEVANFLRGNAGIDSLTGNQGNDTLEGGSSADSL